MLARPVVAGGEVRRGRRPRPARAERLQLPLADPAAPRRSWRRAAYSTAANTLRANGRSGALGGGAGVQRGRGHRGDAALAPRDARRARAGARDPRRRQRERRRDRGSSSKGSGDPRVRVLRNPREPRQGRVVAARDARGAAARCGCTATPTAARPCTRSARMVGARGAFDVVVGSRLAPGADVGRRQPVRRRIAGRSFGLLCRRVLREPTRDLFCGFKLWRAPAAEAAYRATALTGWTFDAETLAMARALGFSITETGIPWTDRRGLAAVDAAGDRARHAGAARGAPARARGSRGRRRRSGRRAGRGGRAAGVSGAAAGWTRRGGRAGGAGGARARRARRAAPEGLAAAAASSPARTGSSSPIRCSTWTGRARRASTG